jgi:peptidyl-prolyl isomerase D
VVDLEEAKALVPGDAAVVRELEAARKRVRERREREKKAFRNAFDF